MAAWIADFDDQIASGSYPRGSAEAIALEILYLCDEYRLGVLARESGDGERRSVRRA